jgi:hypothetical protein
MFNLTAKAGDRARIKSSHFRLLRVYSYLGRRRLTNETHRLIDSGVSIGRRCQTYRVSQKSFPHLFLFYLSNPWEHRTIFVPDWRGVDRPKAKINGGVVKKCFQGLWQTALPSAKGKNYIGNAFDSETDIQTANLKRKCNWPLMPYYVYNLTQGHLVKGEDTEAFSSLLWSRNCTSKTVGANPNLRPHLKKEIWKEYGSVLWHLSKNLTLKVKIVQNAYVVRPD